jgi:hypothetical protein
MKDVHQEIRGMKSAQTAYQILQQMQIVRQIQIVHQRFRYLQGMFEEIRKRMIDYGT